MKAIRFKNGGIELDWKSVFTILGFSGMVGIQWFKLDALEKAFRSHLEETRARIIQHDQAQERLKLVEEWLRECCPHTRQGGGTAP